MTGPSVLETRRMTPDGVLRVLADSHRQQCQYDPGADPGAVISYEMTVSEWRSACDLVDWRPLGRALNAWLRTQFTTSQWKGVLTPGGKRTLRDVCNLIASQAVVPVIGPLKISGKPCLAAGAFFVVMGIFRDAGADVSKVHPSTPIGDYWRNWGYVFLTEVTKMAPGALPPVRVETPAYWFSVGLLILGWLLILLVSWLNRPVLVVAACGLCLVAHLGTIIAARIRPRRVSFGALVTFGDVARQLAGQRDMGMR